MTVRSIQVGTIFHELPQVLPVSALLLVICNRYKKYDAILCKQNTYLSVVLATTCRRSSSKDNNFFPSVMIIAVPIKEEITHIKCVKT